MTDAPRLTKHQPQTFRVRDPLPLLRPAFFACVAAFVIVFLTLEPDARWISLIIGGVLVFALALCYWLMTRTRLEITSREIIYHTIGYRVRSGWSNVEGWGERLQGAVDLECLILREPGMELSGWMRLGYRLLPFMNFAALVTGQTIQPNQLDRYSGVIPVGMFDQEWRSGEIGSLVSRYAPGAFEHHISH